MSDNRRGVKRKMKRNPIFICADVLVEVFRFLPPRQLGLGIAFVSDRFDRLVVRHFRTRQWALGGHLDIGGKIGENGTKEMEIGEWVNHSWQSVPMPDENIPLPANVIGFKTIMINFIDPNVMAFLHRIPRLFDLRGTNLHIVSIGGTEIQTMRISAIITQIIWPLIGDNICAMNCYTNLRHFAPTILSDCPKLKTIFCSTTPKFWDDASEGHALAKWLCIPRGDGIPKVLRCEEFNIDSLYYQWLRLKTDFIKWSSPANFIVVFRLRVFPIPFDDRINKLTGERLTIKRFSDHKCLLVRCPILRDEKQWAEWEKEAIELELEDQWNKIIIVIGDEGIGEGLLDCTNDCHQK